MSPLGRHTGIYWADGKDAVRHQVLRQPAPPGTTQPRVAAVLRLSPWPHRTVYCAGVLGRLPRSQGIGGQIPCHTPPHWATPSQEVRQGNCVAWVWSCHQARPHVLPNLSYFLQEAIGETATHLADPLRLKNPLRPQGCMRALEISGNSAQNRHHADRNKVQHQF